MQQNLSWFFTPYVSQSQQEYTNQWKSIYPKKSFDFLDLFQFHRW